MNMCDVCDDYGCSFSLTTNEQSFSAAADDVSDTDDVDVLYLTPDAPDFDGGSILFHLFPLVFTTVSRFCCVQNV